VTRKRKKRVTVSLTGDWVGRKLKVAALHNGRVAHCDVIDCDVAPQRKRFVNGVCKRVPGVEAAAVEAELLRLSATRPALDSAKESRSSVKVGLKFHSAAGGNVGTVTADRDGTAVHVDQIDPRNAVHRKRFIAALTAKVRDFDAADAERQLLDIAERRVADAHAQPLAAASYEVDVSHVHRPELFHTTDVAGLAVPVILLANGQPAAQWQLHLRWPDGRREARPLVDALDMPGGGRLWLHPAPAVPSVGTPAGWSRAGRRAWLAGEATPDPAALFHELCEVIAYFLEFPLESAAGATATVALWVMLSYGYPIWPAVPYLCVGGPMGSGKSRLLEVLARLVYRPLSSANLTAPALFRTLHDRGGVLLYDEAERLRQSTPDVQELLSMLLAGYRRGGQATRLEAVGDSFRPVAFDVYGLKAVACIQGLPPTLVSRCISVMMFRAGPESPKPRRRIDADPDRWQRLRDGLHALALDASKSWLDLSRRSELCPSGIGGRDYELWQPLLALASWVESFGAGSLLEVVQQHALASVAAAKDEAVPETDEVLLEILAEAVRNGEWPTSREILDRSKDKAPGLFKSWEYARTVTARLKGYGLRPAPKSNGRSEFRLAAADLLRVQRHYGIDLELGDTSSPASSLTSL
jgi:hypothetical protein